jgi:hypothetical protein
LTTSNFEWLQKGTFAMVDLWLYNFSRNIPDLLEGKSVKTLSVFNSSNPLNKNQKSNGSAIVIGAGPSLYEKNHLELLVNSDYDGTVLLTDSMLKRCLKIGINPDRFSKFFVLTIDPYLFTANFYDDEIIKKYGKKIKCILSSCTSPDTVKICKNNDLDIFWFHPLIDDYRKLESISKIMNLMTKSEINPKGFPGLQTAGNVGAFSWIFSWAILGKSPTALIGLNLGYLGDTKIENTQHYNELLKVCDNLEDVTKKYRKILNIDLNCEVLLDPVFDYYREALLDLVKRTPSWTKTINATEGGSLFGEGIENMKLSDFLFKHNN